jgi:hypothetical protein|tara:strand:- start:2801 stop:2977 length:177 start_codon:yes stop_codon:yes gene_type:complete
MVILQLKNLDKNLQVKAKKELKEMLLLRRKFFLKRRANQEMFYLINLLLQMRQRDKES